MSMSRRRSNGTTKPAARVVDVVAADDALAAALEDAENPPFGAIAVAPVLDADDDAVAVHGLIQVVAGDEDARRPAVSGRLGFDEREPAGVGRDPADDQVHPVGQTEALANTLDGRRHAPALADGDLDHPFVVQESRDIPLDVDRELGGRPPTAVKAENASHDRRDQPQA